MTDFQHGITEDDHAQTERAKRRQKSIADTYDETASERITAVEKYEALGLPVSPHMNLMAGYAQQAKTAKEGTK